jgi:abequosyltransferase
MIPKQTKPLLSVCIATYNRAKFIGETLESIVSQLTNEVEVVVVDGASTDNTRSIVEEYQQKCSQLKYVCLPIKGGVDQDYDRAVELAEGEYCWLFPDDDLLNSGAISAVLKEINKGYSLIIVNAQVMNKNFSKVLDKGLLQIDKNEIYPESKMELLFNCVLSYISFIGCVVINRDLWMQRDKSKYFGTEFVHIGVIFQAPLPAASLVIAEPYITIRYGNAQWTTRAFEVWMYKWPNLIRSFSHISKQAEQEYQKKQSWSRLKHVITFRAMGVYSLKEYQKWYTSKDSSLFWKLVALVVAMIPVCFVKLVMLTYHKFIKKNALMTIDNLENDIHN